VKAKLSKSQYVKGLQCPKALWFYRNRKDLAPEVSPAQQALFDTGDEIGVLAQDKFKCGIEVTDPFWKIKDAANSTEKYVADGFKNIFEATAIHPADGNFARIDVLHQVSNSEWDLIEVKSSTQVKEYHIDDLSLQYHVFSGAGYNIRRCKMMVINNQYERDGVIDVSKLFRLEDITEKVLNRQEQVAFDVGRLIETVEQNDEPIEEIGARCFKPFVCDYKKHCWKNVPSYSVFDVYGKKKAESIASMIDSYDLRDVPDEMLPKGLKAIDVSSHLNEEVFVNKSKIKEFLNLIEYPCYYLDYETVGGAVPLFDKMKPYGSVPFQFSLHIQHKAKTEPEHFEFLHQEQTDPRRSFAEALIEKCGNNGSIVVYNKGFEMGCNEALAKEFPEFSDELRKINARMIDLLIPFRNRYLYHPSQYGSASIKAVLPAFTNLSYENLDIGDGMAASRDYQVFAEGKLSLIESEILMQNLKEYCKLDTLAMVELINVLSQELIE
jgi:hypothetical protein